MLIKREEVIDILQKMIEVSPRDRKILAKVWQQVKDLPDYPYSLSIEPDSCFGCKFFFRQKSDFPCQNCIRRIKDYYIEYTL